MLNEFKSFLLRGNVVDLAVGVVVGAAFNGVVQSFVKDVLTPLIAAIGGNPNFSEYQFVLHRSPITYGNFLNALISFLIVAASIFFLVVKPMNAFTARMNRGKAKTETTRACPECLSQIPKKAVRCAHCGVKVTAEK